MNHNKTQRLAIAAIFIAIIIIQIFVPYVGYLTIIPGLPAITTLPLTLAIAGSLLGPKFGFSLGLFWGILSMVLAYTQPSSMVSLILFRNPLIAILPRAGAGLVAGLIGMFSKNKGQSVIYVLAGILGALTNTILVVCLSSLIFMTHPEALLNALGQAHNNGTLIWILLVALGTNGILEAIFAGIFTPIIVLPLQKVFTRRMH
ncbi:putative membrane protein [Lactobacillus colini]|uniref:Membrane protein n=1 Tax=Lactobacillus colini TaxID=1819254 RepID=A0ABS4MFH5_9LACO|nr:ECF transporter S component [Lactobacillus colini]MBP2058433.1 putative membrane protein [Lactobacillus colini]